MKTSLSIQRPHLMPLLLAAFAKDEAATNPRIGNFDALVIGVA